MRLIFLFAWYACCCFQVSVFAAPPAVFPVSDFDLLRTMILTAESTGSNPQFRVRLGDVVTANNVLDRVLREAAKINLSVQRYDYAYWVSANCVETVEARLPAVCTLYDPSAVFEPENICIMGIMFEGYEPVQQPTRTTRFITYPRSKAFNQCGATYIRPSGGAQMQIAEISPVPPICTKLGTDGYRDCLFTLCLSLKLDQTNHPCFHAGADGISYTFSTHRGIMEWNEWHTDYVELQNAATMATLPRVFGTPAYYRGKTALVAPETYVCADGYIWVGNLCVDDRPNQCIRYGALSTDTGAYCGGHGTCAMDPSISSVEENTMSCTCEPGFGPATYNPQSGLPIVPYCSSSCQDNWGAPQNTCVDRGTCGAGTCTCNTDTNGQRVAYGKACEWPATITPVSSGAGVDITLTYAGATTSPAVNDVPPTGAVYRASFAPAPGTATKVLTETISGSTITVTLAIGQALTIMSSVTQPIVSNALPALVVSTLFARLAEQVSADCTLPFQRFPDDTIFTATELNLTPANPTYSIRNSICNAPPKTDVQIITFETLEVYCIPVRDTAKRILGNTYCWSKSTDPLRLNCQFEDTQNVMAYLITTRGAVGDMATLRWDALEYQLAKGGCA